MAKKHNGQRVKKLQEKLLFLNEIGLHAGNIAHIANCMGLSRPTVRQKIEDFDLGGALVAARKKGRAT